MGDFHPQKRLLGGKGRYIQGGKYWGTFKNTIRDAPGQGVRVKEKRTA